MPIFLLDENVSYKIAKHLTVAHGLDVLAFHQAAQFGTPDPDVRSIAKRLKRVLITLDSDFSSLANLIGPTPPGIVWMNPPPSLRTLEGEKRILDRFFTQDAPRIDLDHSIVELTEFSTVILYPNI